MDKVIDHKERTSAISLYDRLWEKKYLELKAYFEKYGHCDVSQKKGEYYHLGIWVHRQRQYRKNKAERLTGERIKKLDNLGFIWEVRKRAVWKVRFNELKRFNKKI